MNRARLLKYIASGAFALGFSLKAAFLSNAAASDFVESLFGQHSATVEVVILLTILALIPTLLIMLTGFVRILITLGFVRNALSLSNMPPNQVLVGLSLFLTYFMMYPVIDKINITAYQPYVAEEISMVEFGELAMVPIREFMLGQTYKSDLEFFLSLDSGTPPETPEDTPTRVLIPSFLTSELKRAFQIGFFIYIPFIVMDMVVASTLMSMGMMMLPPAMISLPFKVLLFVLVDGWQLTIGTVLQSFR